MKEKVNINHGVTLNVNKELKSLLESAPSIVVPKDRNHLINMATCNGQSIFEVNYEVKDKGLVKEATVTKCRNGISVNYNEVYMRRRDPNCLVIGDDESTDKVRYCDKFNHDFESTRQETFKWLEDQNLIVMPFTAGDKVYGYPAILVCPINAAFFAGGLADMQGFIKRDEVPDMYEPESIIYLAPTFRHTHFDGKQVVVHNRRKDMHEVFSFNLYPGPSAKKGIYGVLLNIGEEEKWTTVHASSVRVTTPYDNSIVLMHEGASGGGKSEMIEEVHREENGKILFAKNSINDEEIYIDMADTCELNPITDDMAMCHPELQNGKKLVVKDAEDGWFLRFNHITEYGTSPQHEKLCIHPKEPLIFLNMDAAPDSTILIWDHIMDAPGKACPNPRVIMPRYLVPGTSDEPEQIDIRSFGVRAPLCTDKNPTYGIIGVLHILTPALAWLWRLVAPRGHDNPSINACEGMMSEGVGSYWPFATGKMVDQANLLLEQILNTPETKYVLIPNQNIGTYKVGFNPQWIAREYLARKGGANFRSGQLIESRCPLLGYAVDRLRVDGQDIPKGLLQTNYQIGLCEETYDKGAQILTDFFTRELEQFDVKDLHPIGKEIIKCFKNGGNVNDYEKIIK